MRIHGPFVLVIVDTSIAYFEGDNENDNVQMGKHARMLRSLTKLPDGPTVIVTCHPIKNADPENLVPRGGGAFLNEIDTNLTCIYDQGSKIAQPHHGKIRGVEFAPLPFELRPGTTERLKDSKDRLIWTVTAQPISTDEQTVIDDLARNKEDRLLILMMEQPGLSMSKMAETMNWTYSDGRPNKSGVERMLHRLRSPGSEQAATSFSIK